MSLHERLKKARNALGISQKDAAVAVGIATRTWQVYEEGGSVPGGNALEGIAKLGIDINWLLTGDGEMRRDDTVLAGAALPLDKELMQQVIEIVEEVFQRERVNLPPAKKARLIMLLHDEIIDGEMTIEEAPKATLRLIKFAA